MSVEAANQILNATGEMNGIAIAIVTLVRDLQTRIAATATTRNLK
jgi:hypothetical protein